MAKAKKLPSPAEALVAELDRRIPVEGMGRRKTISKREQILLFFVQLARDGDDAALRGIIAAEERWRLIEKKEAERAAKPDPFASSRAENEARRKEKARERAIKKLRAEGVLK